MDSNLANSLHQTETATFGNGCFWCTEAIFQKIKGVQSAVSGYSGGHLDNPDYKTVCSGTTGHAECLQIIFEPSVISFSDVLKIFWETHDPTSLNRQGEDVGTQYRSVIFFHNENQKKIAQDYINQLNHSGIYTKPIVTTLEKFEIFYPAEDYHQGYYELNGSNPYCQFVVRPKVEKFKKNHAELLKTP